MLVEPLVVAGFPQQQQLARDRLRVGEIQASDVLGHAPRIGLHHPERAEVGCRRCAGRSLRAENDVAEVGRHPVANRIEGGAERRPVVERHRHGQPRPACIVRRQRVGLRVPEHLQPVLDAPQELVAVAEFAHRRVPEQLGSLETRQDRQQRRALQPRVAATADQLQRLGHELDLANAARAELDVFLQLSSHHFPRDHLLHFPQGLEHAEVQVAAIDERPDHVVEQGGVMIGAGDGAGLHVGISLPVPTMLLQVILDGPEARNQRPGVAERPEPHVHTENETIVGGRIQQADQRLPEPREVLLVGNALAAVGVAALRIQEHQVDVRGEVQLPPAQLAHAEHDQLELPAAGRARDAEAPRQATGRKRAGTSNRRIGQGGQLEQGFGETGTARQVAPGDADQFPAPQRPQPGHEAGLVFVQADQGRGRVVHLPVAARPVELSGNRQGLEHRRIAFGT